MKWFVGTFALVSVATAAGVVVRSKRKAKAARSPWTRATSAATSAAFTAANGVKGVVTHH
jgi:hypothetical protein